MNLDKAISNIDQVIANAPMTRYDHDELKSNLALLVARAKASDNKDQQIDILRQDLADVKLELSTPETAGLEKEPLYKWAATIVCIKHKLEDKITELNKAAHMLNDNVRVLEDRLESLTKDEPADGDIIEVQDG